MLFETWKTIVVFFQNVYKDFYKIQIEQFHECWTGILKAVGPITIKTIQFKFYRNPL